MKLPRRIAALPLLLATACASAPGAADKVPVVTTDAAAPAPSPAPAGGHVIRLHRPRKVGDRFHLTITAAAERRSVIKDGAQVLKDETDTMRATLAGVATVRAVNAAGKETDVDIAVEQLVAETPEGRRDLLPRGALLHQHRGAKEGAVRLEGGELSPEATRALGKLLSTSVNEITDDQIFGSDTPHHVGDEWPANARLAAHELSDDKMLIAPEDIGGRTRLVAVRGSGPGATLEVSSELRMRRVQMRGGGARGEGAMEARFHGLFPVDLSLPPIDSTMIMSGRFVVPLAAEGRSLTMEASMHNEQRTITSPVP